MKHPKRYDEAGKRIVLRTCAVCRKTAPQGGMHRVRKRADGTVLTGGGEGRSAYLCKDGACVLQAVKIKALERALRCRVPREIYEVLSDFEER